MAKKPVYFHQLFVMPLAVPIERIKRGGIDQGHYPPTRRLFCFTFAAKALRT
jgi:hypothetical protein